MTAEYLNNLLDKISSLEELNKLKDKKIELLKIFISNLNTEMKNEMDKDGWCNLKIDYETIKEFDKILEEV